MVLYFINVTENHRTQSQYDDAVIVKVFIFEFFNSYTTCFYIAFYVMVSFWCVCCQMICQSVSTDLLTQHPMVSDSHVTCAQNQGANGMFGLSNKYRDWCSENNCMSMLTMNLLIFILSRPAYQFAVGLLLPLVLIVLCIKLGLHYIWGQGFVRLCMYKTM